MRIYIFLIIFFSSFCFLSAQEVDQGVAVREYFPLVMDYISDAFILNGNDATGLTAGQYFNFNNVPSSDRVYPTYNYNGTYILNTETQKNISYRIYSIYRFAEFSDPAHIHVCNSSNPSYSKELIDINSGSSVYKTLGFSGLFSTVVDIPGDLDINIANLPESTCFSIYYDIIFYSFDGPYKTFNSGIHVVYAGDLSDSVSLFSRSLTASDLHVNSQAVDRIVVRLQFVLESDDSFTTSDSQILLNFFAKFYRFSLSYGPYFSRCPHTPSCVISHVDVPSDFRIEEYQGKRVYYCQTHVVFNENSDPGDDPDNPDNPEDPDNPDNPEDPDDPGTGDYSSALNSINNSLSQSNQTTEKILSKLNLDSVQKASWDDDDWRDVTDRYLEQFTSDLVKADSISSFSDSLFGFSDMMNSIRQLLEFDYSYYQPTSLSFPYFDKQVEITLLPWPAPPDSVFSLFRRFFRPLCVCLLYIIYTVYFTKAAYWVLSNLFFVKSSKTE